MCTCLLIPPTVQSGKGLHLPGFRIYCFLTGRFFSPRGGTAITVPLSSEETPLPVLGAAAAQDEALGEKLFQRRNADETSGILKLNEELSELLSRLV